MKIFLNGYWNANLGDDLFLKVLSDYFNKDYFNIIINRNNSFTYKKIPRINLIYFKNNLINKISNRLKKYFYLQLTESFEGQKLFWAKKNDYIIDLGGSVFQLPKKGMDSQFFNRKRFARGKIPYSIMGSNFGPFYHDYQLKKYSNIFSYSELIFFREKKSINLFRELRNIYYTPDIVFALNVKPYRKYNKYILFSIIQPRSKVYKDIYTKWIVNHIRKYVKQKEEIMLMAFCEPEGDLQYCKYIYRILTKEEKAFVKIKVHTDIEESLKYIANAKSIIATRYHAMILGWIFNKPLFVLSYSDKITNVINDIAPIQNYVKLEELSEDTQIVYSKFDSKYFDNVKNEVKNNLCLLEKKIHSHEK